MRRGLVLGALVAAGVATIAGAGLGAQPAQQPQPLAIEQVKGNLYMITGGGGNVGVYIAANGVVLVDSKLANYGQQILDRVKSVTDKPVTHIINTHTHGDHVGSNEFFPASVDIVAHEATAAYMARMPAFQDAAKKHGLPDRTFSDRLTVLSGTDSIDLYYFGPSHTGGDAFVVFRGLATMHAGDAFPGPTVPIMDVNNGGSGLAYADTLAKAAAGVKGVTTVIPGHSGVTTWQAFVDYGEFVKSFVSSIQAAHRAGKTAEQAAAEFTPAEKFAGFNLQRARADAEVIFKELQR
ncbi:MAG: MBL fold metallo-hydrolase [Acidobacteriota bacterium]